MNFKLFFFRFEVDILIAGSPSSYSIPLNLQNLQINQGFYFVSRFPFHQEGRIETQNSINTASTPRTQERCEAQTMSRIALKCTNAREYIYIPSVVIIIHDLEQDLDRLKPLLL